MDLKLEKPIIFLDEETTGKDVESDQIVEISILKVFPDGKKKMKTFRVKPKREISEGAFLVHGISAEDLKDCPSFKEISEEVLELVQGCPIFGYNCRNFDIPLLYNEFSRCGINWKLDGIDIVDVSVIFKRNEPRDLENAYRFYCNKELVGAHNAEKDVLATYEVFLGQISRYPELPNDLKSLALFTNYDKRVADVVSGNFSINIDGEYIIECGKKHKGEKATDHIDYIIWMTRCSPPFPNDTLEVCFKILDDVSSKFNEAK